MSQLSNVESLLTAIAKGDSSYLVKPQSRVEALLYEIYLNGGGGGGTGDITRAEVLRLLEDKVDKLVGYGLISDEERTALANALDIDISNISEIGEQKIKETVRYDAVIANIATADYYNKNTMYKNFVQTATAYQGTSSSGEPTVSYIIKYFTSNDIYTGVEYGSIYRSDGEQLDSNVTLDDLSSDIKASVKSWYPELKQYTINIKIEDKADAKMSIRPFVKVRNLYGDEFYIYDNVYGYTYNQLATPKYFDALSKATNNETKITEIKNTIGDINTVLEAVL